MAQALAVKSNLVQPLILGFQPKKQNATDAQCGGQLSH
jgi:hypothetical protein